MARRGTSILIEIPNVHPVSPKFAGIRLATVAVVMCHACQDGESIAKSGGDSTTRGPSSAPYSRTGLLTTFLDGETSFEVRSEHIVEIAGFGTVELQYRLAGTAAFDLRFRLWRRGVGVGADAPPDAEWVGEDVDSDITDHGVGRLYLPPPVCKVSGSLRVSKTLGSCSEPGSYDLSLSCVEVKVVPSQSIELVQGEKGIRVTSENGRRRMLLDLADRFNNAKVVTTVRATWTCAGGCCQGIPTSPVTRSWWTEPTHLVGFEPMVYELESSGGAKPGDATGGGTFPNTQAVLGNMVLTSKTTNFDRRTLRDFPLKTP